MLFQVNVPELYLQDVVILFEHVYLVNQCFLFIFQHLQQNVVRLALSRLIQVLLYLGVEYLQILLRMV